MQQHAIGLALLGAQVTVVMWLHFSIGDRQHLSHVAQPDQGLVALLDLLLEGDRHLHPGLG